MTARPSPVGIQEVLGVISGSNLPLYKSVSYIRTNEDTFLPVFRTLDAFFPQPALLSSGGGREDLNVAWAPQF